MMSISRKLCVVFALLIISRVCLGQNVGGIIGNVADAAGSAVVGAKVVLDMQERSIHRETVTNQRGEYVFSELPVGTYAVTINAPTFQTYAQQGIVLESNQNRRVDAILRPGSVEETITVGAQSAAVETRSATIGTTIDAKLVEDLPIDGRNIVALAALLPGVMSVNAPTTFTGERNGPTYNSSGSRNTQNLMLLDGAMWNNLFYNTGVNFPPPNALQEVTVLLNNYKAQYGRNVGSIFNVLTKSGTNDFHGSLWEYAQNTAFDAADYFTKVNPKLIQNQFGGTLGGPLLRNKIYFFAAYQDLRLAATNVATARSLVPAEAGLTNSGTPLPCVSAAYAGMTCANFANDITGTKTVNNVITNPLYNGKGTASIASSAIQTAYMVAGGTGTSPCLTLLQSVLVSNPRYLPNAEVPSICINPVTQNILKRNYVPLATTNQVGLLYSVTSAPLPRNDQNGLIRFDLNFGRHTVDMRYNLIRADDHSAPGVSQGTGVANYEITNNSGKNDFGNIADTWVITPNLLNVARVSYKRYTNVISPRDHTTLADLGANFMLPGVPVLPELEVAGRFNLGGNGQGYQSKVNQDIQIDDNLSWTHGNHNFIVGTTWLRLQYLNRSQSPGVIGFSSVFSGIGAGDFIFGLPESVRVSNQLNQAGIQHELFLFAQDDWRATARLTLNLGVRYELPFQWYEPDGLSSTFLPGFRSLRFPTAPAGMAFYGDKGVRRSLVPSDFNGVAPRVGFAYDVFGNARTSIRGAFGMFFDAVNANVVGVGEPFYFKFNYADPMGGFSQPLQGEPAVPLGYDPSNPQFVAPYSAFFPDANFRTPYVFATNLGFQQQLTKSATLEVNYVAKFARKLTVPYDLNPAIYDCSGSYFAANPATYCTGANTTGASYTARVKYPGYDYGGEGLIDFASVGTSNYNALQMMYRQRSTKFLTMLATYTYSRALDIDTNGQDSTNEIPNVFNLSTEYGPSDYDATHSVALGWALTEPPLRMPDKVSRYILNNWMFTGIYTARTGVPINVQITDDQALTDEPNQRPNLVPGVSPGLPSSRHRTAKVAEWFNTSAYQNPTLGTYGNVSRNSIRGPAYISTNFGIGRSFPLALRSGAYLQFRGEAINIFNTPNLANPENVLGSVTFGQITSTTGSNTVAGAVGRRLQLSLTLWY